MTGLLITIVFLIMLGAAVLVIVGAPIFIVGVISGIIWPDKKDQHKPS